MSNDPDTRTLNALDAEVQTKHSMVDRDPAPYVHEVIEQQFAGRNPTVHVYMGVDAWYQAEHRRRIYGLGSVLVLPPGKFAGAYFWPALDAPVVFQGDGSLKEFHELLCCLRAAGGRSIIAVPAGARQFVFAACPRCAAAASNLAVTGDGGGS